MTVRFREQNRLVIIFFAFVATFFNCSIRLVEGTRILIVNILCSDHDPNRKLIRERSKCGLRCSSKQMKTLVRWSGRWQTHVKHIANFEYISLNLCLMNHVLEHLKLFKVLKFFDCFPIAHCYVYLQVNSVSPTIRKLWSMRWKVTKEAFANL